MDTHLNSNHPDFNLRLEVNAHLRDAVDSYIEQNKVYLGRQDKIKVIELGASLGAISSLYVLDGLYRAGLTEKVELTLLDIFGEPLERYASAEELKVPVSAKIHDGEKKAAIWTTRAHNTNREIVFDGNDI